jgi:diguanylate cyclase (GGDEF)-like protein
MTLAVAVGVVTPLHRAWPGWPEGELDSVIHVVATLLVAWRAIRVAKQRLAWSMLAVGLGLFTAATLYAWLAARAGVVLPFPSLADLGWLLFFPFAYVAVIALIHGHGEQSRAEMSLDGLIAGLGVAAVFASVVVGLLIAPTPGRGFAALVALGYPVGDALLVGTVLVLFTIGGRSGWRNLGLLSAGMITFAVGDTSYVVLISRNAYHDGGLVSLLYLTGLTLIALCAWPKDQDAPTAADVRRISSSTALPTIFALSSLGLILIASRLTVPPIGIILAGLTLLTVVSRAMVSFRQSNTVALHDRLTGLPNRTLLADRLELALARHAQDGTGAAILFLDLDRFKLINDGRGHTTGDAVLQEVSRRLAAAVRRGDTAARFGGDEFVVVCDGITGPAEADEIAERLSRTIAAPMVVGDTELAITASVGIAMAGPGDSVESLLSAADIAMYEAKDIGRGQRAVFRPSQKDRASERLVTETALRTALELDEFRLVYQPVVSFEVGHIVGFEALLRWHRADGVQIGPAEFIPVAEDSGLIGPLGAWVLEQACRQLAAWKRDDPTLTMAVNVSPRQLTDPSLYDQIAAILTESGIRPESLTLEITESALLTDFDATAAVLRRIKELGVRLAMDDFGTGYSSLAYVSRLPIDVVKIDRSLVDGVVSSVRTATLVSSANDMFHGLGLAVIVEGVESVEQATALREMGCDLAQGFLFAQPMPAEPVANLIDIEAHCRRVVRECAMASPRTDLQGPKLTVVVVDDDPAARDFVTYLLSSVPQIQVLTASSAAEFADISEHEHPDLVLMGLHLPDSCGFAAVERLRRAKGSGVPIVTFTPYPEKLDPEGTGTALWQ